MKEEAGEADGTGRYRTERPVVPRIPIPSTGLLRVSNALASHYAPDVRDSIQGARGGFRDLQKKLDALDDAIAETAAAFAAQARKHDPAASYYFRTHVDDLARSIREITTKRVREEFETLREFATNLHALASADANGRKPVHVRRWCLELVRGICAEVASLPALMAYWEIAAGLEPPAVTRAEFDRRLICWKQLVSRYSASARARNSG